MSGTIKSSLLQSTRACVGAEKVPPFLHEFTIFQTAKYKNDDISVLGYTFTVYNMDDNKLLMNI